MTGIAWEDEGAHGGLMNRRSNTSCLTEQEIEEFLFNRLSGVTREVIEEHLLICHACLDRVENEESYMKTVKAAAREIEGEDLERAFAGGSRHAENWRARIARWFGAGRSGTLTVALASIAILGAAVLFQVRMGRTDRIQDVSLELHRGPLVATQAPAGVKLRMTFQVEDLQAGEYRAELVDAAGEQIESATVKIEAGKLVWSTRKTLPAGAYWVRLRRPDSSAELVREYGLVLR